MQRSVHLKKRFLCRILGVLGLPQQPVAIGIDPMLVPMVQLCECTRLIDLDAFYQLFVREGLHDDRIFVISV
jgi:hypothetical protein